MQHNPVHVRRWPPERPPLSADEITQLATDVIVAYGDLAKGFIIAMVERAMNSRDEMMEDIWLAVGAIIWEADPNASAGCPAELAAEIRLH
ncbi:hypothetical protein GG804_12820 [Sphingomonas histidinilytica]|uniref:hypothetical protein n=1 Tax=Rhizorhabdus histidinilytica TaxID=439228 RepID=UPI001ADCA089|nr:hypothetical protein [Rhizorhabdus histidinilytica]MBO9377652.1 hypothetical protein [Rhizorhabdus histidinilytica]